MLVGQNLGGSHEGRLLPIRNREQHGKGGNDGLPGTDVALQQPLHLATGFEVGGDLFEHALLRAGEREGQDLLRSLARGLIGPDDNSWLAVQPLRGEPDREEEELLEDHSKMSARPRPVEQSEIVLR